MILFKPVPKDYLTAKYFWGFAILLLAWMIVSFRFKKYALAREVGLKKIFKRIFYANFMALAIISIFLVAIHEDNYSRMIFFGVVIISTVAELIFANLNYLLIHTVENATDLLNPSPSAVDMIRVGKSVTYKRSSKDGTAVRQGITEECGEEALQYIEEFADINDSKVLFVSTTTRFNIQLQPDHHFKKIINLKRVNDLQYINKFFESINRKLPENGIFIGCAETDDLRKKRILHKYWPGWRWVMYSIDFIIKRVFPKFILTKKIYFLLTRGENRVISRAEVLGRLYSCGFDIVAEKFIGRLYFFVVKKNKMPAYDMNPTYGPFVKLKRIGMGGKTIKVYKLRTMHPYAEYLQDYVYENNDLEEGGKFRNDFRISSAGKFFRMFWLDELPMLVNFFKGELKLFGIRPLSKQYFDLYSDELKEKRIRFKPGLIPPFYADMPKTLDEIQESEMRYLNAYEKHPFKTDFVYFWKAFYNIIFKKVRSK